MEKVGLLGGMLMRGRLTRRLGVEMYVFLLGGWVKRCIFARGAGWLGGGRVKGGRCCPAAKIYYSGCLAE